MSDTKQDMVREWLGAYLDGELNADRRAWVEEHLAGCARCREELRSLRALSDLLHADPEPVFAPSRARRPLPTLAARPVEPEGIYQAGAMRWAPLALFGLWAFFQAALASAAVLLLGQAFLPLSELTILPGNASLLPLGWIEMISTFFGLGDLPSALTAIAASPALKLVLIEMIVTILVSLLFLSWLVGLYSHRRSVLLAARG